jgi:hypothetical protein
MRTMMKKNSESAEAVSVEVDEVAVDEVLEDAVDPVAGVAGEGGAADPSSVMGTGIRTTLLPTM